LPSHRPNGQKRALVDMVHQAWSSAIRASCPHIAMGGKFLFQAFVLA